MAARSFPPDRPLDPRPVRLNPIRLKKRRDFLRAQRGVRQRTGGLVLEVCSTPPEEGINGTYRLGFTASRKVGGAVERNRAKRRLRAVAGKMLPDSALERTDYVLIAKTSTLTRPFPMLLEDLAAAIRDAHLKLEHIPVSDKMRDKANR
jgi:ribonuclease P protein component